VFVAIFHLDIRKREFNDFAKRETQTLLTSPSGPVSHQALARMEWLACARPRQEAAKVADLWRKNEMN
jgi:hypothetical protein